MANKKIQEQEVIAFLNSWKEGIIAIGKEYLDHKDYKIPAEDFISKHYGFDEGEVLFKPTLTKDVVFRNNSVDALSYFIKGHIDEDGGFAIRPWKKIDLLDSYILIENDYSFVMGVLHFIPWVGSNTFEIAFTFVLTKDSKNNLKIKVHHSSPITPYIASPKN